MSSKEQWNSGEKPAPKSDPDWDKKLITELATASIKEQRRSRRWGIFFKFLGFAYLSVVLLSTFGKNLFSGAINSNGHTAVVDVYGVIASDQPASASVVLDGLNAAFESEGTKAVLLRINSPGGSPVQSGVIYDEIIRLRALYPKIPLYAVIEDICASGGYYIAAAAEKIFADKASLVGSIGVRMDGFGFVEAMNKIGVERRLLTAGDNKALLDPFTPTKSAQVEHLRSMLDNVHQQFITAVKNGRGDRIKDQADIYSGLVWSGEQALDIGLIDALADERSIARDIVKTEKIINFTPQDDLFSRVAGKLGASIGDSVTKVFQGSLQLQ
jgi:protease-4